MQAYEVVSSTLTGTWFTEHEPRAIAFSPDGERLYVSTVSGALGQASSWPLGVLADDVPADTAEDGGSILGYDLTVSWPYPDEQLVGVWIGPVTRTPVRLHEVALTSGWTPPAPEPRDLHERRFFTFGQGFDFRGRLVDDVGVDRLRLEAGPDRHRHRDRQRHDPAGSRARGRPRAGRPLGHAPIGRVPCVCGRTRASVAHRAAARVVEAPAARRAAPRAGRPRRAGAAGS